MNSTKVITANLLIDGQGGTPIDKGAIVLEGSKIAWVGPAKDLPRGDGPEPETLDFPNGTILPGLVDVHNPHQPARRRQPPWRRAATSPTRC